MMKKQVILACAGLALALGAGMANAEPGRSQVATLIKLMDSDKNGIVSKAEFMTFMSKEFDRVDANHSGSLSAKELARSALGRRNGRAELKTVEGLIKLMDRNHTGEVEKDEFLQFVSEEFDRIDADKSGALTHEELSSSVFVHPQQKSPGGTHK